MTITQLSALLFVGLFAGFLSGMVGVGGGIVIVPVLVYFLGLTQHQAQGTVLFMLLLPIGILGVFNYYKSGNVDIKYAFIIASTFVVGCYFGSKLAISLEQEVVKKIFGCTMLLISLKMIFWK